MRFSTVKSLRRLAALALALAAGVLAMSLNSCSTGGGTVFEPPQIEGATFVGDKACAYCHAKITRVFPSSPHARLRLEKSPISGQNGCESCHGPASRHVVTGAIGANSIVNPGKDSAACFQCHLQTQSEFHLPHHHPVIEGKMNCVQCHDPHSSDIFKPAGGLAMSRLNESCAQCHRPQTRPVAFEHPAMREGCVTCHNPHGSVNRKMLTQSDPNLCLRCHAQVPGPGAASGQIYIGSFNHTIFLKMGGCWTAGCHTAVHGSNVDVHLRY